MTKQTQKSLYPSQVFSGWQKAQHGPMPTNEQLEIAHVFGRPGKQALGIAMALRDGGISESQMRLSSALFDGKNTTCRNKMVGKGGLVECGFFDRAPVKGAIKLTLTKVGLDHIAKHGNASTAATKVAAETPKADKPKAKAKAKARKAKAPKAVTGEAAAADPALTAPATENVAGDAANAS